METTPNASHGTTVSIAAAIADTLEMRTLNVFSCTVAGQIASAARTKLASTDNARLPVNADRMHYAMYVTISRSASAPRDTEETADWDAVHQAIHAIRIRADLTPCAKLTPVVQCVSVRRG